jgi:hypothetical protein
MGRYYSGDIEGKFWFGVQSSDAADRFGVEGVPPETELVYSYDEDDLPSVEEEIASIISTIGEDNISKLDAFFDVVNGYNDAILKEHGISDIFEKHISDYADLCLGIKIRDCIKEQGDCSFNAEL